MAVPLFVLVKSSVTGGWAVAGGPTDPAGAVATVQATLASQPGARALVVALARSFTAVATVNEDASPSAG